MWYVGRSFHGNQSSGSLLQGFRVDNFVLSPAAVDMRHVVLDSDCCLPASLDSTKMERWLFYGIEENACLRALSGFTHYAKL